MWITDPDIPPAAPTVFPLFFASLRKKNSRCPCSLAFTTFKLGAAAPRFVRRTRIRGSTTSLSRGGVGLLETDDMRRAPFFPGPFFARAWEAEAPSALLFYGAFTVEVVRKIRVVCRGVGRRMLLLLLLLACLRMVAATFARQGRRHR